MDDFGTLEALSVEGETSAAHGPKPFASRNLAVVLALSIGIASAALALKATVDLRAIRHADHRVRLGAPLRVVPDVVGLQVDEAKRVVRSVGLDLGTEDYYAERDRQMRVIGQEPPPGLSAPVRSVVGIRLATSLERDGVLMFGCPDAEPQWYAGPPMELVPGPGQATQAQAFALQETDLLRRFGAVQSFVYDHDGFRWRRFSDGSTGFVAGRLASLAVVLPARESCPSKPELVDGVPITFLALGPLR